MSFVAIDLGASGTRFTSESGQIQVIPNNVVFMEDGKASNITPDASDIDSSLEVTITKTAGNENEYLPATVLMGIMAERYPEMNERPSVLEPKYKQKINYVSTLVATAINKLKYGLSDNLDLYLAVPPVQITKAKEVFAEKLTGSYNVSFPKYMGGTVVEFTIDSVNVYEESFMALTSFFFNMNGTVNEKAKAYMNGTVLSLDIGASTSDLSITKRGRFLDKSGQTYTYGGNEVRGAVVDGIRERYNIDLPVEDADRTMAEGRLQLGNTYEDITDIIGEAKAKLAKKLTQSMQTYFGKIEVPISTVNAIVVSGGGSLQSQYVNDGEVVKTSEPMSYYVTQELTKWCKGVQVVQYGDEARLANTRGLFIKARRDALKKQQDALTSATSQTILGVPTTPTVPVTPVAPVAPVNPTVVQTQATPVATPVAPVVQPVQATPVAPTVPVTPVAPQVQPAPVVGVTPAQV